LFYDIRILYKLLLVYSTTYYDGIVNLNKLAESLKYETLKAVNSFGIHINKAFEYKHYHSLLLFISGLGPRKANSLVDHRSKGILNIKVVENTGSNENNL
jgi:transcriptional accessory protein Tex/SPT6